MMLKNYPGDFEREHNAIRGADRRCGEEGIIVGLRRRDVTPNPISKNPSAGWGHLGPDEGTGHRFSGPREIPRTRASDDGLRAAVAHIATSNSTILVRSTHRVASLRTSGKPSRHHERHSSGVKAAISASIYRLQHYARPDPCSSSWDRTSKFSARHVVSLPLVTMIRHSPGYSPGPMT